MRVNIYLKNEEKIKYDKVHQQFQFLTEPTKISCIGNKLKIKFDSKLELHLKNSEVVAVPILTRELAMQGLRIISNTPKRPISGTHDGIYLTIVSEDNKIEDLDKISLELIRKNLYIILLSAKFNELLVNKSAYGVRNALIELYAYNEKGELVYDYWSDTSE